MSRRAGRPLDAGLKNGVPLSKAYGTASPSRLISKRRGRDRVSHAATIAFEVVPRRRVVDRTLAWLDRSRRLTKDFQATIGSATAWLYLTALAIEWE